MWAMTATLDGRDDVKAAKGFARLLYFATLYRKACYTSTVWLSEFRFLFISFLTKVLHLQHTCLYKGGKSSAHGTPTRVIICCESGWLIVFPDVVFHLFDQVSISVCDTSCLDVKFVHDCQSIKPAVHWCFITVHLYGDQISIGVVAMKQACCEPGLQSSIVEKLFCPDQCCNVLFLHHCTPV